MLKVLLRILIIFILSFSPAYAKSIYSGLPEIAKLNPAIRTNAIFNNAPTPHVSVLTFESEELKNEKKFSRYQIQLVDTQGPITRYRTREVSPENTEFDLKKGTHIVRGDGVGYGGIFMLEYRKEHSVTGKAITDKDYYIKYEIASIDNEKGKLFPLAVGNQLTFNFHGLRQDTHSDNNEAQVIDNGTLRYQIVEHFNGLTTLSGKKLPGDIYLIRVSRTTANDPNFTPIYDYYFSKQLGWYVSARYYKNGKPVAIYRLVNWKI